MRLKNPLKRKDNYFKKINKQTKAEFREIRKVADPVERLARYEKLNGKFPWLYGGNGQLQRAVNAIDMYNVNQGEVRFNAGISAFLASAMGGSVCAGLTLGTALFPPGMLAVAALGASTAVVARHLTYRGEANRVSLTTRDVKFAVKTKWLEKKVKKNTKSLSLQIEKKKELQTLRGEFKPAADGTAPVAELAADDPGPIENGFVYHPKL
jgi:hypothetical protein